MANIFGNNLNNNLVGGALSDNIFGFGGNDNLFGNGGNDVLLGFAGNDLLNGGIGADVMLGGTENDTYIVDNVGDVVFENFGEGIADRVVSSISFSLSAAGRFAIENLTLQGGAVVGLGNALDNQIVGNNLANTLNGLAGNDSLFGLGGNDFLFGGINADFLNGGVGSDTMRGEAGNDTYVVDSAGDVVIELAGAGSGIDRIISSVVNSSLNFGGRINVENLTLIGAAVTGTGNALGNEILGDNLNNTLLGLGGNDTLIGSGGRDILTGGAANDIFDYNRPSDSPANAFRDIITDFDDFGNDRIDLSDLSPGVLAFIGTGPFTAAGQVRIDDIAGPDVRVEVNLVGAGVPEMQIQLLNTTAASMIAADFIL